MAKSDKSKKKVKVTPKEKALFGFPSWMTNSKTAFWGFLVFGFLLYANAIPNDYALDDAIVINDNMFTQEGLSGVPGILSKDTFFGFFKEEGKAALVAGGRYRPLSLITFAIEVQLFGLNPQVSHFFNALLYGFSCGVLYLLLLMLFRGNRGEAFAVFVAFVTTLLFTAHPIHTEAVANIKGRDEILTLLGSIGAMYYSLLAFQQKKLSLSIWAGVIFFLALMAKENAITFLAVVPLAYYFFTKASTGDIIKQVAPFAIATVVFLVIRFSVLGFAFSEPTLELMNNPYIKVENGRYVKYSSAEKLATVTYTMGKYLQLLVVPHPLTHDYYPRHIPVVNWGDWRVLLSLLLYIAMAAFAIIRLRKKDILSFAILFYLATFSIVSNLFFPVGTNMSERFAYIPSIGFCMVVAVLLYRYLKKGEKVKAFHQLRTPLMVAAGITLLFSIKTLTRNPVWKDNFTLFSTDINTAPNSAKMRNAMGGELVTQSQKPENKLKQQEMLTEAVGHLREAVKIHPNYKNAYLLMGNANNYLKQYDAAITAYNQALAVDPAYAEAETNLAITYMQAGRYYGQERNNLPKSIEFLEKSIELRPNEYETLRLLGVAYGISGRPSEAIEYFTRALNVRPNDPDAMYNLGNAYYNIGQNALGEEWHQKAFNIDPNLLEKRRSAVKPQ